MSIKSYMVNENIHGRKGGSSTMTLEQAKQKIAENIFRNKAKIIEIGRAIYARPELGFKEWNTAKLVQDTLTDLQIPFEKELAVTGVMGCARGKESNARVMIMGELDAVVCPLHPQADPQTGAAHSCGHNAQIASMLGAAFGLRAAMDYLDGDVVYAAVPAEEYVELEWRESLRRRGEIEFFGGKQEFIRLGLMDEIDCGMMVHSHAGLTDRKFLIDCGSSGFLGKLIRFEGIEAHAGAQPFDGINALNAAALSLMAIGVNRETFREEDRVRVHPIITKGGDLVNIVPADVRMETYVRARTIEAVVAASEKVNRAIKGSAMAVGAQAHISEMPGYLSLCRNAELDDLFAKNADDLMGTGTSLYGYELMGSTDAGDLSSVMPFAHFSGGGYMGNAHSKEFAIVDEEMAYIYPAVVMAQTTAELLWDGAKLAKHIRANHMPKFSKEQYGEFWQNFNRVV